MNFRKATNQATRFISNHHMELKHLNVNSPLIVQRTAFYRNILPPWVFILLCVLHHTCQCTKNMLQLTRPEQFTKHYFKALKWSSFENHTINGHHTLGSAYIIIVLRGNLYSHSHFPLEATSESIQKKERGHP